MSPAPLLRLSRFVVFIDYGEFIELQHGARRERHRVPRPLYEQLRRFAGFRVLDPGLEPWVDAGVLVPPYADLLSAHGPAAASEAAMAADYQRWYWRHEVESEREYRWLGEVVVKMPTDLFYLQELLTDSAARRVLELGAGRGGGLWYLGSVLQLLGGGTLVSLSLEAEALAIDASIWKQVTLHRLTGDALAPTSLDRVAGLSPAFDLLLIDLGGPPRRNLDALGAWAPLVAADGVVVVEDLWAGLDKEDEGALQGLDDFLLSRREFGLCECGARHPMLKGIGLKRIH